MNKNNTNNTIEKPISLILEDSKQMIVDAINNTGLHIVLLEPIVKDLYNEIKHKAIMQLEHDRREYEIILNKQTQNNTESNEEIH